MPNRQAIARPPDPPAFIVRPLPFGFIPLVAMWGGAGSPGPLKIARMFDRPDTSLCCVHDGDWAFGDPVGFAILRYRAPSLQVRWIAVAPPHRRQGIATRLIGQLASLYRDLASAGEPGEGYPITAVVDETRADLIGLFRKCGGKASLVRRISRPTDGILFTMG